MDLIGKTLGNYQIVAELGRGGMGVVYRAYQTSLNRYVAVKVLPPQFAFDDVFVQRFLYEARASAQLKHPNIVTIYDVAAQDNVYYIVMEEVIGEPLSVSIRLHGQMDMDRCVRIISQIASALDFAHAQGIVHRDIKPSNIIVGAGDQATLTDFGIAKAATASGVTRTGMVVGTPEYMSPEQARGAAVDARTDLYSLGVICYELLGGRVPFAGDTLAVLHAHAYEALPSLRSLNPRVPKSVEQVVAQALAKRPEDRYPSTGAFAAALATAASQAGSRSSPARRVPVFTPAPTPRSAMQGTPVPTPVSGAGRGIASTPAPQAAPPAEDATILAMATPMPLPSAPKRRISLVGISAIGLLLVALFAVLVLLPRGETNQARTPVAGSAQQTTAFVQSGGEVTTMPVGAASEPAATPALQPTDTTAAIAVKPESPTAKPPIVASPTPTRRPTFTATPTTTPTSTFTPVLPTATPIPTQPRATPTAPPTPVPPTSTPVLTLLAAPSLIGPEDGWQDAADVVTLAWQPVAGAAGYAVELRSDRAGQTDWRRWLVADSAQLTLRYADDPAYFSTPGTVYFWRAAAMDGAGTPGVFSAERRFVFQRVQEAPPTDTPAPPPTDTPSPSGGLKP